jgi:hypothetical protein
VWGSSLSLKSILIEVLISGLVALKHLGSALMPRILVVSEIDIGVALLMMRSGNLALLA